MFFMFYFILLLCVCSLLCTGYLPLYCFARVIYQLLVPRAKTAIRQRRAFSVVGPSTWNGLPLEIRLLPKSNESAFCTLLKTDLYHRGWAGVPLSRFLEGAPYKFLNE